MPSEEQVRAAADALRQTCQARFNSTWSNDTAEVFARAALEAAEGVERTVPVSIDPCLEKREPDEPMFILLARDSAAPRTLGEWCCFRAWQIAYGLRPDTPEEHSHIEQIRAKIEVFSAWRRLNRASAPASKDEADG